MEILCKLLNFRNVSVCITSACKNNETKIKSELPNKRLWAYV